jgi:hypothetical protein
MEYRGGAVAGGEDSTLQSVCSKTHPHDNLHVNMQQSFSAVLKLWVETVAYIFGTLSEAIVF